MVCGEDLPVAFAANIAGRDPATDTTPRCRLCQLAPPPFERAVAYGSYDGALRDLVHLLKFDQVRPAAGVLGSFLADSITALEPSLPPGKIPVVPVPLYARKRSQRGFNQAELIARSALKHLLSANVAGRGMEGRFELRERTLVRLRDTGSQIGLTRHQRRQNLRGAFAVRDAASIVNRDVLLIDDVYTTGATASECARVLRRAGAAHVWVATAARTMRAVRLFDMSADSPPENDMLEEDTLKDREDKDRVDKDREDKGREEEENEQRYGLARGQGRETRRVTMAQGQG